jgi:hypothetical protein
MTNVIAQSTTTANAAGVQNDTVASMPSIKLDALGVAANIKVESVVDAPNSQRAVIDAKTVVNHSPKLSVERAAKDDMNLVKHDRAHYVSAFKRGVEKTARATLEMCRVVYEASRVLDSYQFQNFCKDVGYRDGSSTIRKFIAIGKVYPRFIDYADQMPSGWTAIYQITQIPADDFEAYLKHGKRLDELKGKRLAELTNKTLDTSDITKPLAYDDKASGHVFAKVVSTKKLDAKDWRAIEKAMNEMAARLPVKFVVPTALKDLISEARLREYEQSKKHYVGGQQFRPDTWDMGEEANAVLPRTEPDEILG